MVAEATTDAIVEREPINVELYRRERFQAMGFDELAVNVLIAAGVPTHDAQDLLDHGCSHVLVVRLLG